MRTNNATIVYKLPIHDCEDILTIIYENLTNLSCVKRIDTNLINSDISVHIENSEKSKEQLCSALFKISYLKI